MEIGMYEYYYIDYSNEWKNERYFININWLVNFIVFDLNFCCMCKFYRV